MHRRQRTAQLLANERRLARAERSLRPEQLFERAAPDILHPQADAAVPLFGAVDGDHVAVAHPREDASLMEHLRGQLGRGPAGTEQLQGDVAGEPGVLGPVDVTEGAVANLLEQREVAPELGR